MPDRDLRQLFETALAPATSEVGREIDGYLLLEELGRGGSAIVWLAIQQHSGREVAVKILKDRNVGGNDSAWGGGSSRQQARFHREVEIASILAHPNIARVYDSGLSDEGPYLVLELVEGRPAGCLCA